VRNFEPCKVEVEQLKKAGVKLKIIWEMEQQISEGNKFLNQMVSLSDSKQFHFLHKSN